MPNTSESDKLSISRELSHLTVKRSSVKGQITKFKNYLFNISQGDRTSHELAELSLKLGKFESLFKKFDDLQSEIEVLNSDNLQKELDEREIVEDEFVVHIAAAKKLLDEPDIQRRESYAFHDASCALDSGDNNRGFRLPQIQIAKFDGSYFRWLEFHDTFETLIHKNASISPIHKFHYLVSYLEGDAARIISNLEMSSSNYPEAWKLLCERYNNKRLLINHHINSLLNIQAIARESERSLRFMVDHMTKNLRALASLGQPTDKWDMLLIFMFSSKLDNCTLSKWEEHRNTLTDIPSLDQFKRFLIDRADVLESINRNKGITNSLPKAVSSLSRGPSSNKVQHTKSFACSTQKASKGKPMKTKACVCAVCGEDHRIYDCPKFKSMSVPERWSEAKRYRLCLNCLRQGHLLSDCRMGPCRECNAKHNSLLHGSDETPATTQAVGDTGHETVACYSQQYANHVLLSTALIKIYNPIINKSVIARALLDCGSQSSFITRSLKDKLALKSTDVGALKVIGIGNSASTKLKGSCTIHVGSLITSFKTQVSCLVIEELTSELPKVRIDIAALNLPSEYALADPYFNKPSQIDILLGADIFWELIESDHISLGPNCPKLHNSKLGWLVSGPINTINTAPALICNHACTEVESTNDFNEMLSKFWCLESVPEKAITSDHDKTCELHFKQNTVRLENGRFRVKLPFKKSPDCLGDTYLIARKRFLILEKRFKRNPLLKAEYSMFIKEYEELGHLSTVEIKPQPSYFLCHHAVLKDSSESTKLRVVFDGSASSSSGISLNDILMVGPNVQDSLFSILIRARQYKYLLTADIEKMYRQVEVTESDRNFQLILWREDESNPIKILRLNTLTYGTASASYLSTRCLYQLAEECDDESLRTIIQRDFYVDDLITGCDDDNKLRELQKSISKLLSSGCFNLRKYKSNLPNLLDDSSVDVQQSLTLSESSSTLGLGWNPNSDSLHFPFKAIPESQVTKRFIMSQSFRIFDPLGLLSPCIIWPKIMLQRLWRLEIDWDQPVPDDVRSDWEMFARNAKFLQHLEVPRKVLCDNSKYIEIHSFSDASQLAYGACVYIRSVDVNDVVTTRLLCSKSKVAPLKPTTIPRLELCAALLAAKLCKAVLDSINVKPTRMVHWCDSNVTLSWIRNDPTKLKVFVANRVVEITEITDASSWRYVPTHLNPADLVSRGVDAKRLIAAEMWWSGPNFLSSSESDWPVFHMPRVDEVPEIKTTTAVIVEPIINVGGFLN